MSLRRIVALAGTALVAFALAGCATATPGGTPTDEQPSGVAGVEIDVESGWLDGGRMIALVTWGSSTCIPFASDVTVDEDGTLAVALEDAENEVCTRDMVPRASAVGVPEGVDPSQELAIRVSYGIDSWGETDLDPYDGGEVAEFTPSAGWVDDELFAIVTWGSSSCAPAIESVEAETAGEAVVTFVTPPEDQVCTMDMAPRVVLASVQGVDDDAPATVTLTGGAEFAEPLTIPIV